MSFQPIVPATGIVGWSFLQRTYDSQFETFGKSVTLKRETDYFRENIGAVRNAEDLVNDRRLLAVALGAYGLSDDLDNRAFVLRILQDGTSSPDALANRLADERYKAFSDAFGFGPNQGRQNATASFADTILSRYEDQVSQGAAGAQSGSDAVDKLSGIVEAEYFRTIIGTVRTADDLLSDPRLLSVALDAFGLAEYKDSSSFLKRVLEADPDAADSFVNRLADDRLIAFSGAFGFSTNSSGLRGIADFSADIIDRYKRQRFEMAVGNQDETMRIALFAQRELSNIADSGKRLEVQWLTIMGQPPLRTMMETALGLPSSFGQVEIDKQRSIFQDKSRQLLGTDVLSEIAQPEVLERLTNAYLARAQINAFAQTSSSASIALSLLAASQA